MSAYGNAKMQSLTEGGFCQMAVSRTVRLRKYICAKRDSTVCSVTVERWCSMAFLMRGYILALRCCPERKWVICQFFFSVKCLSLSLPCGRARKARGDSIVFKNLEPTRMSKPSSNVALNQCSRALQNFPSTTVPRHRDLY